MAHLNEHDRDILECPVKRCKTRLADIAIGLTPGKQARQTTARKMSMKRHVRDKHLYFPKNFDCPNCGEAFARMGARIKHQIRMHQRKFKGWLNCAYCEKRFTSKGELKTHVQKHTEKKDKMCPHCKTTYTHKESAWKCKTRCEVPRSQSTRGLNRSK